MNTSTSSVLEFLWLVENVTIEQRINLYSDYLYKADNIDVDYTKLWTNISDTILNLSEISSLFYGMTSFSRWELKLETLI